MRTLGLDGRLIVYIVVGTTLMDELGILWCGRSEIMRTLQKTKYARSTCLNRTNANGKRALSGEKRET